MRELARYAAALGLWWGFGAGVVAVLLFVQGPLWSKLIWILVSPVLILAIAAGVRRARRHDRGQTISQEETIRRSLRQTPVSLRGGKTGAFEVGLICSGDDIGSYFAAGTAVDSSLWVVVLQKRWPFRVKREFKPTHSELTKWGERANAVFVTDPDYAERLAERYFDPVIGSR